MEKEQQQTDWANEKLTQKQLAYAANDVFKLLEIHEILNKMICSRRQLSGGNTISELNTKAQSMLSGYVDLIINGYGDKDNGWYTSIFQH